MVVPDLAGLKIKARTISSLLLEAFGNPVWKKTNPLDELILTILSQNTNDRNRDNAYLAMRRKFHTWEQVRDAPLGDLVDSIRTAGLGNQKAQRIQKILAEITHEHGDLELEFLAQWPAQDVRNWLMKFKGVGHKTAAIVMQFSLGMPAFPVDTHVYRVSGCLGLRAIKMNVEHAHQHLESIFAAEDYGHVHLNLIRLGREICRSRNPNCIECPLKLLCDFQLKNEN